MCCGKIKKATEIVKGYVVAATNSLVVDENHFSVKRTDICKLCEDATWLERSDYLQWLKDNGVNVLKNFDDLTVLPMLEKHDFEKGKSLFCRICKCWIPAKTSLKDSKCPKDKW